MVDFFYKGGPLMYPLLLCSILMLALSLERGYNYFRASGSKEFPAVIKKMILQQQYNQALELAKSEKGPVAAITAAAIQSRQQGVVAMEEAISVVGSMELKRLSKHLHVLELIGRLSPLVGLFGTVLGMTEAFRVVADSKVAVNPSMLAGGIWEALITTVAGLAVAIPAMVVHHFCEDYVRSWAFSMKRIGREWIKLLEGVQA